MTIRNFCQDGMFQIFRRVRYVLEAIGWLGQWGLGIPCRVEGTGGGGNDGRRRRRWSCHGHGSAVHQGWGSDRR